ncbi:MAG: hypothetical protein ACD_42C00096G0009 [uncultured bacterium]|nr:MAG: hypothetical protein ACD_42C00096G0009 [uncultured bacterium]OGT33564.1 MAG: hypothetical protein A3C44_01595 [Gammaproteobacteria bacterium RIFCSPHIGHO2_02_FULL_39_13]OGT49579.1 MAG: hypothetical protein A3E53_00340 [Gammaproteobacteria bacterium RIFCSPHIGHO2_12_FULL_39_24]
MSNSQNDPSESETALKGWIILITFLALGSCMLAYRCCQMIRRSRVATERRGFFAELNRYGTDGVEIELFSVGSLT